MKKHIIKSIALCGLLFASASCLNLDPQQEYTDVLQWSKAGNYTSFANQFYGWTQDFNGGGYVGAYSGGFHNDSNSDLLDDVNPNEISQGGNTGGATDGVYNDCYARIYYTNLLLNRAKGFADQDAIKEPRGEAHFFRAYLYFELVQRFGDVILLHEPIDLTSERLYTARDNRTVVVDAIIEDLKAAAGLLPDTPREAGRLSKWAALAMLSRVGLYEGTWQKNHVSGSTKVDGYLTTAVEAAWDVMESTKYRLFYSDALGIQSYRYMFILEDTQSNPANLTKADNTEYIFTRRHDETLKRIGINITHGLTTSADAHKVTRKLANMYRCTDGLPIDKSPLFRGYATMVSEFDNRDNRMQTTMRKHGQVYFDNDNKPRLLWNDSDEGLTTNAAGGSGYQAWKWATERQLIDANEGYDWPVIRYAEVLLNYAEAKFELNGSISNEDLDLSLNLVRARVNPGMTKLSNELVNNNSLDMRTEIRAERTVELFDEGFRLDDLKRWKTAVTEMNMDLLGVKCSGTAFEAFGGGKTLNAEGCIVLRTNRAWTDKNYLFPLPANEVKLNPNLGQNPDWN